MIGKHQETVRGSGKTYGSVSTPLLMLGEVSVQRWQEQCSFQDRETKRPIRDQLYLPMEADSDISGSDC